MDQIDTHITVAIIANNGCGNADADLVELMLTGWLAGWLAG